MLLYSFDCFHVNCLLWSRCFRTIDLMHNTKDELEGILPTLYSVMSAGSFFGCGYRCWSFLGTDASDMNELVDYILAS